MVQGLQEPSVSPTSPTGGDREKEVPAVGGEGMNVKDEAEHGNLIC